MALLLHGKIGLWSIKSSLTPTYGYKPRSKEERQLADAVVKPPLISGLKETNMTLWDLERRPHGLELGYARFASATIRKRVIEANRRSGLRVDERGRDPDPRP